MSYNLIFQFNIKQKSSWFLILKNQSAKYIYLPEGHSLFPFPVQNQVLLKNWKSFKTKDYSENTDKPITVKDRTGTILIKAWYQLSECIIFYKRLHFCVPFSAFKDAGATDLRPHPAKHLCPGLLSHAGELPGTRKREPYISEVEQSSFTAWAYAHHCQT